VTQKAQPLVPIPPEGVRIVRRDGIEIPCEVKYVGVETRDDGEPMHEWRAVSEYMPDIEAGDTVKVDVMPPRTSLSFDFTTAMLKMKHVSNPLFKKEQ